jgi:hypothetical protein
VQLSVPAQPRCVSSRPRPGHNALGVDLQEDVHAVPGPLGDLSRWDTGVQPPPGGCVAQVGRTPGQRRGILGVGEGRSANRRPDSIRGAHNQGLPWPPRWDKNVRTSASTEHANSVSWRTLDRGHSEVPWGTCFGSRKEPAKANTVAAHVWRPRRLTLPAIGVALPWSTSPANALE